jgi:acetate kinase
MKIIVLNSGSSSVKYAFFEGGNKKVKGIIDRIGLSKGVKNHSVAIKKIL